MIYRFSLFVTGNSYSPITNEEIKNYPIHIYTDWTKNDMYRIRTKSYCYEYGGSHLLHDSIFATTEEDMGKIIRDYLTFLEENKELLQAHGATEINISATVYTTYSGRFLFLTTQEMSQLLHYENISISLDILCLKEEEMRGILQDMLNERTL